MKRAALILALALVSCSPRIVEHFNTEYRDTTIYLRERHDSLIYVPLPLESNQAIVEIGDTSRLETSVAKSEAFINKRGHICHTLENKREPIAVLVPVLSTYAYSSKSNSEVNTLFKTEWKDKPLTRWQTFRLKAYWWLLSGLVLSLLWIFRKPIIKLLKI